MAWSDYKICDLCGNAKVFYDANILDERYCATWGEPSDYDPIGLKAICGKCNKTHEVVIAPRADLPPTLSAALEVPEVAAMWHALLTWDAAHRTGKNEPLQVAFELGHLALAELKGRTK